MKPALQSRIRPTKGAKKMRAFALVLIALSLAGILSIVSNSRIAEGHKTDHGTTISIDPTQLTLSAGALPTAQVNEPF
jgi:hypothetical protein